MYIHPYVAEFILSILTYSMDPIQHFAYCDYVWYSDINYFNGFI